MRTVFIYGLLWVVTTVLTHAVSWGYTYMSREPAPLTPVGELVIKSLETDPSWMLEYDGSLESDKTKLRVAPPNGYFQSRYYCKVTSRGNPVTGLTHDDYIHIARVYPEVYARLKANKDAKAEKEVAKGLQEMQRRLTTAEPDKLVDGKAETK